MILAIIGYGKMGKAIETLAAERGHSIGVVIDNEQQWEERREQLVGCDVAVDFTQPTVAVGNIRRCFALGVPIVVGTTGWYDSLEAIKEECAAGGHSLFVASNFSIGMNIMFELNRRLALMMNGLPSYDVSIEETHHIHKLDAPSGTAITLARDIIKTLDRKEEWALRTAEGGALPEDTICITAIREGEVPGTHVVAYDSEIDTITVSHSAKSRKGLALGAVMAAEFLKGKRGYYTMGDMLNF